MDREPDFGAKAPTETLDERLPWDPPSLAKLEAGEAETGALYGPDGTAHS